VDTELNLLLPVTSWGASACQGAVRSAESVHSWILHFHRIVGTKARFDTGSKVTRSWCDTIREITSFSTLFISLVFHMTAITFRKQTLYTSSGEEDMKRFLFCCALSQSNLRKLSLVRWTPCIKSAAGQPLHFPVYEQVIIEVVITDVTPLRNRLWNCGQTLNFLASCNTGVLCMHSDNRIIVLRI
jgi:hypothetical protein